MRAARPSLFRRCPPFFGKCLPFGFRLGLLLFQPFLVRPQLLQGLAGGRLLASAAMEFLAPLDEREQGFDESSGLGIREAFHRCSPDYLHLEPFHRLSRLLEKIARYMPVWPG